MDGHEARKRLWEVQRIMECTTLCTLLPDVSAIIGGVLAIAGCFLTYAITGALDFQAALSLSQSSQTALFVIWGCVGVISIAQHLLISARTIRKRDLPVIVRPGQLAILALAPSVLVAIVLSVNLWMDGHIRYIAPIWIICYGLGVFSSGLFSLRPPRVLGVIFILIGAVGLSFFQQYGLVLIGLSFGLGHIVFGLLVVQREKRDGER